jgi:hypothetical protein
VHLRRALLLFAIVLGLAAIAASLSRQQDDAPEDSANRVPPAATEQEPTVSPGSAEESPQAATVVLRSGSDERVRATTGQPVTLEVTVDEAGLVDIPELGLSSAAEPLTPARFEILVNEPGRYPVTLTPAEGGEEEAAGTLVVREAGQ